MATDDRGLTVGRVGSDSVRKATGRDWKGWLQVLDEAGAAECSHKEIVAYLEREHPGVSSWWRQSVTVGYQKSRGKRVLGETADAGFQVGVRRTVATTPEAAWELITSRPDLWLGDGASVTFAPGEAYEVPPSGAAAGVRGEIRVVKPGDRLRMTWQPDGWAAPATLQIGLSRTGPGRTAVQIHLEKLPDAEAREAMRAAWNAVLERVAAALS